MKKLIIILAMASTANAEGWLLVAPPPTNDPYIRADYKHWHQMGAYDKASQCDKFLTIVREIARKKETQTDVDRAIMFDTKCIPAEALLAPKEEN